MGAGISIAATAVVVVRACAGVGQCGSPGACVDVGQLLPWVMLMASMGFGKGGGAPLPSVVVTDFVGCDTSLSLPLYSSFRFGTHMCCATLAKLLN